MFTLLVRITLLQVTRLLHLLTLLLLQHLNCPLLFPLDVSTVTV